jgi:hypothetical protein
MFTLLIILAVAYMVLKALNVTDEFRRRDAAREAEEKAAMEAEMEEEMEAQEIRIDAVDVEEIETIKAEEAVCETEE